MIDGLRNQHEPLPPLREAARLLLAAACALVLVAVMAVIL